MSLVSKPISSPSTVTTFEPSRASQVAIISARYACNKHDEGPTLGGAVRRLHITPRAEMAHRNLRNKDATVVRSKMTTPKKATRDPERTKQRILTIASEEFANKGYDGARVDEIVRRSKVSKNLIYYYFGSKEELFIAVPETAYVNLREQQDALGLNAIQPEDAIRKLVTDLFHYWRNSRAFIGFLTSENFHKARHIKKSKFAPNAYHKLIESL
jgi:TetR/AcrR family transcriptional regulator